MDELKLGRLIGLAHRARKLEMGHDAVDKAIIKKSASLLLLAKDASENLRKMCPPTVPTITLAFSKEELGITLGRKPVGIIAVCNTQFAKGIRQASDLK